MDKFPNEKAVSAARKFLKERLVPNKVLRGFEEEKKLLLNVLLRSVRHGESDSVLVIGPPGSGKSTLVSESLKELMVDEIADDIIVVRLNGLVHTDDNLALREIIRQLHFEELSEDRISGTFSDNLLFLLQSLRSGEKDATKPVIFILDEFQLFCSHRNQTLLYNLFDVAQSAKAPVCIVGLTCRIDITEMLEKRVKSRFSHRQITLFPSNKVEDRLLAISNYLRLPEKTSGVPESYKQLWNNSIQKLLGENKVIQLVRRQLEIDCNEKKLESVLFLLVCRLSEKNPFITAKDIEDVYTEVFKDAKVELLKGLSVLELCLVIAMKHQTEIYDGEPFNFEMIVNRYLKFAGQYSVQIIQRPILLMAFERIKDLELILLVSGGGKTFKKECQLYSFVLTGSQVSEAVNNYPGLPTEVSQWAVNNISTC